MLDKVVYFSGIHSSGKSTIIEDLMKRDEFVKYSTHLKVNLGHTYHRMIFRLSRYWIEAQEMEALSNEFPEKIVLGDRCIHDNLVYSLGFYRLGWIPKDDFEHNEKASKVLFRSHEMPKNVVNVSPPLEWIENKLNERWKTRPKKWHEDDFDYLREVANAFPEHYSKLKGVNVLQLKETDRQKRVDLVLDWIHHIGLNK